MQQGERGPGPAGGQRRCRRRIAVGGVPVESVQQFQRPFALPQQVQDVGDAVAAVVEAGPRPAAEGGLGQPPHMRGVDPGPGAVQGVEHSGRAVRQSEPAVGELGDVAREQAVGAFGGGGRGDPGGERVADRRPVGDRCLQQRAGRGAALGELRAGRAPVAGGAAEQAADVVGVTGRYREAPLDGVRELPGLVRVEGGELGQRVEEPQPQRRQRVPVHVRPGAAGRGGEAGGAQRGAQEVVDGAGEFEVDQGQLAVRPDDQVARVEVPEDDAALVDRGHRAFHLVDDGQGVAGVPGDGLLVGVGVDQRVADRQPLAQRLPGDVLLDQELVLPGRQQPVLPGDSGDAGQPYQDGVLVAQPGHRVDAALVQPGERAGLLEHHLRPVRPVLPVAGQVDATGVGEVQDPLDRVGESGVLGCRALRDRFGDALRHRRPGRHRERGPAHVRHQPAFRSGQGQDEFPGVVAAVAFGEPAVPQVQRPVLPAQVAQDVRAPVAVQQRAESVETALQLGVVDRVQGAELPTGTAGRVLGVLHLEDGQSAQELEGDAFPQAEGVDGLQHLLRGPEARGDVDLPALVRDPHARRTHHGPHLQVPALPALGQRPGDGGELLLRSPAPGRVVEDRVGVGVGLVAVVQRNPPRGGAGADRAGAGRAGAGGAGHDVPAARRERR